MSTSPGDPSVERWRAALADIAAAARRHGREAGEVSLLAVSKRQPVSAVRAVAEAGQRAFGENYLQEALPRIEALAGLAPEWHFIGRVQSNKTAPIATHFDWVHTLERARIAERLARQRPAGREPLDVCIEVNVSGEASKGGVPPEAVRELAEVVAGLPALRLRGLMCLPAPAMDFEAQRRPFRELAALARELAAEGYRMDTLSMGTTADMEAAIAEGSTLVRIGTAVFGPRR